MKIKNIIYSLCLTAFLSTNITLSETNDFKFEDLDLSDMDLSLSKIDTISHLRSVLMMIDPQMNNAEIKESKELKDMYEVNLKNKTIFINKEGTYIIPLIYKIEGTSYTDITKLKQKEINKNELMKLKSMGLINYPATNKKLEIFVFSDYTCPYCRKFHENILELNNLGIDVNYIPFPRHGVRDKKTINGLKKIICSVTPSLEFNKAFENHKQYSKETNVLDTQCEKANPLLIESIKAGNKLNILGTPYIYLSDGTLLGGWTGLNNFKRILSAKLK